MPSLAEILLDRAFLKALYTGNAVCSLYQYGCSINLILLSYGTLGKLSSLMFFTNLLIRETVLSSTSRFFQPK
jgi:hypothetical protein